MVAARAPFSTRLSVANGIFMSKLCYLIQLWGGADGYLLHALQVIQNRAARAVTRMTWFTSTRVLLNKCKWISVKQLVFYHRALTTYKIVKNSVPIYLHNKMNNNHPYETRQATDGGIRFGEQFGIVVLQETASALVEPWNTTGSLQISDPLETVHHSSTN